MDLKKKHKMKKMFYGIFGLFIPLYSLIFSQKGPHGDLVLVTFSQIGARYGAIEQLIIWGIITSLYYFSFLSYLFDLSGSSSRVLRMLLSITCLTLLITVFLPYAPSMFPIVAATHNYLAYITATATVFTMSIFIISLYQIDEKLFYRSLIIFAIAVAILIYFLITFGVSSLFQIVLSFIMCSLMYVELILLEKSPKINIYQNTNHNFLESDELNIF